MTRVLVLFIASSLAVGVAAQSHVTPSSTPSSSERETLEKIRVEGLERSQAERVFTVLTSEIGARLTGSPAHARAVEFARRELAACGLANVHLHPWKFGRGWALEKLTVEMIEPRYASLIAYADAWSPATSGEIVARPVFVGARTPDDLAAMRDALKGAVVMIEPIVTSFVRQDRARPGEGHGGGAPETPQARAERAARATRDRRMTQALRDMGVAAVVRPSVGEHGTVFVTGRDGGPGAVPSLTIAAEHYNSIARLAQRDDVPVRLRVNIQSTFPDDNGGVTHNVIAELPGSDPAVRDEVVMIGGHLDSWHAGTGAADNADGAATVIEAMRILAAIGARPRRTIRAALWGGEEQGLLGSQAWVREHLGGPQNARARANFNAYFNVDAGTGKIYGWFLQENAGAQPIFDAWLAPLQDLGTTGNVAQAIGSSDHLSFAEADVPAFNPIQDYANYDVRTHHTNMDTAERVNAAEIRQAAVVMATFAYRAAMADKKIPRQ